MVTAKNGGKVVEMHVEFPTGTNQMVKFGVYLPDTILAYGQVYIEPDRQDRCFAIFNGKTLLMRLSPIRAGIPVLSKDCRLPDAITLEECVKV